MEDVPPSYECANTRDCWPLIAPYVCSLDLCSAALVSRRWHQIFAPQLWGNPASHFSPENDVLYVALTRFRRTLSWARPSVRELTHTLHLPPAHAEIYGGPHAEWLRDMLERLPRLQSLLVDELPFFDHACLTALRHASRARQREARSAPPGEVPVFPLRLLDAARCFNATSTGLAEALRHFPALMSLDLSGTSAARNESVLRGLRSLSGLRILKLRGLGLRDEDLRTLAAAIGTRVRSLDVRDNQLTDESAGVLLETCLAGRSDRLTPGQNQQPTASSPALDPRLGQDLLDIYESEDLDQRLRKKLIRDFVGRLAIEDGQQSGITHLYISKNLFTVAGVSRLLGSKRLHVLDVGTLPPVLGRVRRLLEPGHRETANFATPGAEQLIPVIASSDMSKFRYLRFNYAIVTEDAPLSSEFGPAPAEVEGDLGRSTKPRNVDTYELDATPMAAELEPESEPRYELPGDPVPPSAMPSRAKPSVARNMDEPVCPPVRRGSIYAPEVVDEEPVLNAAGPTRPGGNEMPSPTYTTSAHDRRARLTLEQSKEHCLHPGMIRKVRTLVLTDVPIKSSSARVPYRIVQFIKDCAEEVRIARLQANATYALPPGRSRQAAERDYARSIFAMRRIVLELAPEVDPDEMNTDAKRAGWKQTKSSTEDPDSEALWSAAENDFSFFNDDFECGLIDSEFSGRMPLTDDKFAIVEAQDAPQAHTNSTAGQHDAIDVVSEISKYRKRTRAAYERAQAQGTSTTESEEHWPGDVTVVWPQSDQRGTVDWYGNFYEKDWYYR
ncbi:hypothetical protein BDY21DRAFT_291008 [Lineolata rhizophorae]|uniref:F-box domain-containing protein n=1 Tax=Lineolata rhizophorae TaxID=578093 RepID=A0A6A6NTV7_9PEZI|nr:hypothetical protein BDY21DRAFT_291008 [Lineolata rhizophorae]